GTWRVAGFAGFIAGATQFAVYRTTAPPTLLPPSSGGTVSVVFNAFRPNRTFEGSTTWPQPSQFDDTQGTPLELFAVRQGSSAGSLAGGWSSNFGAVTVHGIYATTPPPFAAQTPKLDIIPAGGTVRAITGTGASSTTSLTDLY